VDVDPEVLDLAQLRDLFCRKEELGQVSEVLAYGPEDLASIDVALVPLQEFLGCSDIFGNGLLRQDMFTSQQGLSDEVWLDQNRKAIGLISLGSSHIFKSDHLRNNHSADI
jgi:hypothetical protein